MLKCFLSFLTYWHINLNLNENELILPWWNLCLFIQSFLPGGIREWILYFQYIHTYINKDRWNVQDVPVTSSWQCRQRARNYSHSKLKMNFHLVILVKIHQMQ
jgi:hypothetical protein